MTSIAHHLMASPDLMLVNGTIITVDENVHIAEVVAIQGDQIIAVEKTTLIDSLGRTNTQRFDLEGHTITPGSINAHAIGDHDHHWRILLYMQ